MFCTAAGSLIFFLIAFAFFQPSIREPWKLSYINNQQSQDERNEDEPFRKMHLLFSIV